eukprot:Blabericola_migrator_1__1446@NODE_137_length_13158_cov_138_292491_g119_i0_p2_GENE_NODE_137_length_13158_cov_138_292491_g119_i0NODE_137_length_13158_cov_138_292491_g119_i0_p2_ORF_typecomplete_len1133_score288_77FH2/PF02181_23/3e02FH2/PF02181_23/2_3e53IL15/PF02372_15/2_5IL15/PF02372_15/0_078ABC_tran_CTD/PF16326_5/23ABC_tran_CTD/PF16326_5/52_NODE_137_length_13158_cov_138_292491_g119_i014524850
MKENPQDEDGPIQLILKTTNDTDNNTANTKTDMTSAPKVCSLAADLLRAVEPLHESLVKLKQTLPTESDVHKHIQCFMLRLDPLLETTTSLVEESADAALNRSTMVVKVASLTDFFHEIKAEDGVGGGVSTGNGSVPHPKAAVKSRAVPTPAKKPPPSKKAPPQLKAKAPPPSKGGKKPPPAKVSGGIVPKLDLQDLSKKTAEAILERVPEDHLIPKAIQWLGITPDKANGTIWENLLKRDRESMTARDWSQRYIAPADASSEGGDLQSNDGSTVVVRPDAPPFKFEVHYPVLNTLFFHDSNAMKKETAKPLSEAVVASARTRSVSSLDPKRAQRIEISLKGCKLYDDFSPIYHTICELKFDEVNPDNNTEAGSTRRKQLDTATVQFLLEVYPTPDEIKLLKNAAASLPPDQRIAPADQFLLELLKIPRFHERAEAVCTKMTFNNDIGIVTEKLAKLLKYCDLALDALSENGLLKPILALILKMGNYINCKSKRTLVCGLQMAALENLKQVKSIDGSKNFIRVVADHIDEQLPLAWKQLEWICTCSETADINPDDCLTILNQLENKVKKVQAELNNPEAKKDLRFVECFKDFVEVSLKRVQDMKGRVDEVKKKLTHLSQILADKARTPKEALEIFKRLDKFGKDLYNSKKEMDVEKALSEKRKARAAAVDKTPLAGKASAPVLKLKAPPQQSKPLTECNSAPRIGTAASLPGSSTADNPPSSFRNSDHPRTPPSSRTETDTTRALLDCTPAQSLHRLPLDPPSRTLKPVATADPLTTPMRGYPRTSLQGAVPKSPPAVTMLHRQGKNLDPSRIPKQQQQRNPPAARMSPRAAPDPMDMYDHQDPMNESHDVEYVLEENLGIHKKPRSTLTHGSSRSTQNALSPDYQNPRMPGYTFQEMQRQRRPARRVVGSPASSHASRYSNKNVVPPIVLTRQDDLDDDCDNDLSDELRGVYQPPLHKGRITCKLSRVPGDVGDEVGSLGSQSSLGSGNMLKQPSPGIRAMRSSAVSPIHLGSQPFASRHRNFFDLDANRPPSSGTPFHTTCPSPPSSRHSIFNPSMSLLTPEMLRTASRPDCTGNGAHWVPNGPSFQMAGSPSARVGPAYSSHMLPTRHPTRHLDLPPHNGRNWQPFPRY